MFDPRTFSDEQQILQMFLEIQRLQNSNAHWDFRSAIPTLIGALLGLCAALFLDHLKTRREDRQAIRIRRENELSALNRANIALAFNVEILVHAGLQQILPHHDGSVAALALIRQARTISAPLSLHDDLSEPLREATKRCPLPHLLDLNLLDEAPFLLSSDPSLLSQAGWITSFAKDLIFILTERNKLIDKFTLDQDQKGTPLTELEHRIETQVHVASVEVGNCMQLLQVLIEAQERIKLIAAEHYKDAKGAKLSVEHPPVLAELMAKLAPLTPEPPA